MTTPTYYDYDNQCYIVNGKVDPCNHPATMNCGCYGRLHAGEPATVEQKKKWDDRLSARGACRASWDSC